MYTTTTLVKTYLGISGAAYDAEITQLIADAENEIHRILDIDGFGEGTTTESIPLKDIYVYSGLYAEIYLRNYNVTGISKINGQEYDGDLGVDYKVTKSRAVRIKNYSSYLSNVDFGVVDIEYEYGYETIPGDIQLLTTLMVGKLLKTNNPSYTKASGAMNMSGVSEYRLADETIKFGQGLFQGDAEKEKLNMEEEARIKRILDKYKKTYVLL